MFRSWRFKAIVDKIFSKQIAAGFVVNKRNLFLMYEKKIKLLGADGSTCL